MSKYSILDLVPGMITAEDVYNEQNHLVVPKDVVLTPNIISRLDNYSIYYVQIKDDTVSQLYNLNFTQNDTEDSQYPDQQYFKRFFDAFNECAVHLEQYLSDSLYKNEPFIIQELLNETLNLMNPDGYQINLFDMLLNLKNHDDSVYSHSIDVALIAGTLARWLHFSQNDQAVVVAAGLLHDVGKLIVPQNILKKPTRLTTSEFEVMKTHTTEGYHVLKNFTNIPESVRNVALLHHEKCDGSGYPYGLKGDEIDKYTKIVTIADIFDAMSSSRVYRRRAICPFDVIKHFEDEGLQKYELKYILTFLENVSNSYLNHKVVLSNGMEGNVIFINPTSLGRPTIVTKDNNIINLTDEYYKNIMALSGSKNISIETIL
jgi:putative nucleotidyltransferase with HDIG domain